MIRLAINFVDNLDNPVNLNPFLPSSSYTLDQVADIVSAIIDSYCNKPNYYGWEINNNLNCVQVYSYIFSRLMVMANGKFIKYFTIDEKKSLILYLQAIDKEKTTAITIKFYFHSGSEGNCPSGISPVAFSPRYQNDQSLEVPIATPISNVVGSDWLKGNNSFYPKGDTMVYFAHANDSGKVPGILTSVIRESGTIVPFIAYPRGSKNYGPRIKITTGDSGQLFLCLYDLQQITEIHTIPPFKKNVPPPPSPINIK